MSCLPYKLRTDAWWLDDDITWRTPTSDSAAKALLDPPDGSVICDRGTFTKHAENHGAPHPDC